ncbi:MAG: BppU family phage baseplate upper protein [Chloroflexota bacterium]|nr:BppU family phage baseplate upper protein [Chloroflexota bacterium]
MSDNIQVGAIGLVITLTIMEDGAAVNISSAATRKIKIRKPDGTVLEKDAAFTTNGSDGKLTYTTVSGDIDQVGQYKVQAYVEMSSFTGHSTIRTLDAKNNL